MGESIVCRHCHRHLRKATATCPFCSARQGLDPTRWVHTSLVLVTVATGLVGCADPKEDGDASSTSDASTTETEASTSGTGTMDAGTTGVDDSSDDASDDGITLSLFLFAARGKNGFF